jgi:predicted MFS family arabinose efflux permease
MNLDIFTYLTYLALSIVLTIWVARTLHKNGRHFLIDVFRGDEALADSVNHLLVVGFYLINLGYISLMLKLGYIIPHATAAIEALSQKVGMVLVVLGVMHFFNLYIFSRIRRRSLQGENGQQALPERRKEDEETPDRTPRAPYYRYQAIEDGDENTA